MSLILLEIEVIETDAIPEGQWALVGNKVFINPADRNTWDKEFEDELGHKHFSE